MTRAPSTHYGISQGQSRPGIPRPGIPGQESRPGSILALTIACAWESSAAAAGKRLPSSHALTRCLAVPLRRPAYCLKWEYRCCSMGGGEYGGREAGSGWEPQPARHPSA